VRDGLVSRKTRKTREAKEQRARVVKEEARARGKAKGNLTEKVSPGNDSLSKRMRSAVWRKAHYPRAAGPCTGPLDLLMGL